MTHFKGTTDATEWDDSLVKRLTGKALSSVGFLKWLVLEFFESPDRIKGEVFHEAVERFALETTELDEIEIDHWDDVWVWTRVGIQEYKTRVPEWMVIYEEYLKYEPGVGYVFSDVADILRLVEQVAWR